MTQLQERTVPKPQAKVRSSRSRRLYLVDAISAVLFVLVMNVPLTGVTIHEWLGLAIGAAIVAHLVQHIDWVLSVGRRLFGRTSLQNRINHLMMLGLFTGFSTIILSGMMISEAMLPWLGVAVPGGDFWLWLHLSSVGWIVAITAIHIAMNWRWIVSTTDRLVVQPLLGQRT